MYQGTYHGKGEPYHAADLDRVLQRAWAGGMEKMIITAGTLEEARMALDLARRDPRLFCTVGIHPTRCTAIDDYPAGPDQYLQDLLQLAKAGQEEGKVVAIGECGLDYARLEFCPVETQKKYFEAQFALSRATGLPLFLHLREAAGDFMDIISRHLSDFPSGVVHSFDGSVKELNDVLQASPNLYIGLNGCSLRTDDNIAMARDVPLDRLMLETDCPWCDLRPTHASAPFIKTKLEAKDKKKYDDSKLVKGRNEPCNIIQVFEVITGIKGLTSPEDLEAAAEQIRNNTNRVFFGDGS